MSYSLTTSYVGESLISGFNWFNGADPTSGFVSYQSQQDAQDKGLFSVDPTSEVVRLGVDSTNKITTGEGRPSIRLESKDSYNHGLFIADFLHMPSSQCGVWPAFWAYGADWPNGGEIDIVEGANQAYSNVMSSHTSDGCTLNPADDALFTGHRRDSDCAIGNDNVGCGHSPPTSDTSSYGDGFNAIDGGVYAMQWDSDHIRIWHFPRGAIPTDIGNKKPDPKNWGPPQALFGGSKCNVDDYYNNMNIVINIDFCGDYGDATWSQFPTCTQQASTCSQFVANNPEAFKNTYWDIRYIDVYAATGNGSSPSASAYPTASVPGNYSVPTTTVDPVQQTAGPTQAPVNPPRVDNRAFLGCFESSTGFKTFNLTNDDSEMTLDKCVKVCNGAKYAGAWDNKCYCADHLDAATQALANPRLCNHQCPGDKAQFCGGVAGSRSNVTARTAPLLTSRDAPSYYLLSVYAGVDSDKPPKAPPALRPAPTSGDKSSDASSSSTGDSSGGSYGQKYGAGTLAAPAAPAYKAQGKAAAAAPGASGVAVDIKNVDYYKTLYEKQTVRVKLINGVNVTMYAPMPTPTPTATPTPTPTPRVNELAATAGAWNGRKRVESTLVAALAVAVFFVVML